MSALGKALEGGFALLVGVGWLCALVACRVVACHEDCLWACRVGGAVQEWACRGHSTCF